MGEAASLRSAFDVEMERLYDASIARACQGGDRNLLPTTNRQRSRGTAVTLLKALPPVLSVTVDQTT